MKIAIVGAMDSEIMYLKDKMEEEGKIHENIVNNYIFYEGKIKNKEIILVKSGVGRTSAAILLTTLLTIYKDVNKIINVGIAGGYGKLNIGDIVVGENTAYGDVDLTAFSKYVYGQMSSCPPIFLGDIEVVNKLKENNIKCHFGTICTTEKFTTNYDVTTSLINTHFANLNILAFDMESASFAQVAYMLNVPFIAIRAISDVIGDSEQVKKYKDVFEEASIQSNIFLLKVIELL